MADYPPPTQDLPIFDTTVFSSAQNDYLTYSQAADLFLTFPTAQGDETLQNITVNGVSEFNGALVMPDGSTQSSAYTGAGIAKAGSYVSTNLTLDVNGKISAISSGNPIPSTIVISSTDTPSTVYPVLTDTNGASQALLIDNVTTSLSYVPSTGTLQPANLISGNIRANTGFTNADGTVQTSAYTGGAILAGSYTNTNITVNNQGKITALANGSGGGGGGTNAITAVVNTTDTASTLYPLLSTVGVLQTIYADDVTTPLSYTPFTGVLSSKTITTTNDITVNTVSIGTAGISTNLNIGSNFNGVLTTGNFNMAFGNANLSALTSGAQNIAIGTNTLKVLTTGTGNTSIGVNSGSNTISGSYNTYVGSQSGQADTGSTNSCFGNGSRCGTFSNSTAIGQSATATADTQIMLGATGTYAPVVVMNKGCNISGGALVNTGGITASGTQAITFGTNAPTMSGASITSATIPIASVVGTAMDLTTNQSVNGTKIFSNTISGSINGTANTSTNIINSGLTANTNYPLAYLSSNTAGANVTVSSDTGGNHLLFNPTLNQLSIAGNVNINGSASNLTIGSTGTAISCPSATAISAPSANITATTFTGALAGNASTASNIALGTAGDLLYQGASNSTTKLPIGTSTYILTSNGVIPQWTAPSVVSTPTLANVLLAGNSAGATNLNMNSKFITGCQELDTVDIVSTNLIQGFNIASSDLAEFNSCVVDTTLTSTGNATFNSGVILGASAPLINSTSTSNPLVIQSGVGRGITLKTGGATGISTTLGSTGILTLAQPPVMSGASITSATIPISSVVGTACDLSTVQNIGGDKTFINPPSLNGSLIVGNSIQLGSVSGTAVNINTPQTITAAKTFSSAITASAGVIGNASTASISTNIQGGSSGLIPYQTAVDSTLFTAVGTAGQILKSNGGGAPTWTTNIVGNAATATTASSVSGGTVSATTGTFGTSLLSSGPLYIGSATQTLGTNSGAINFDGTTLTQLNITSNATNGDIKFFQNNGGASLNTLTIPATGIIQFPNSTNYVGSSVTGCSKVQSSASLTTGLIVQNTVGNTGDMVISQSSVTGTQQLILQTAATNTTGGIVISPKGTPALTIAPTGISTFTNSIVLQATAPTTNVSGYLGYIGTITGNQPATLTAQTSNAIVSVSSASTTLQIGTYLLNFSGIWTAAVVGTFSAITIGLSTAAGTTYTAGTGAIYVYGYTATVGASNIYFNASKVFTVTAATAYYLCTQCAYTGTNNGQILGSSFVMTYTRIA